METRLQLLCEVFGWQNGTLAQVRQELKAVYNTDNLTVDIIDMSDDQFETMLDVIKAIKFIDSYNRSSFSW